MADTYCLGSFLGSFYREKNRLNISIGLDVRLLLIPFEFS